MGLHRDIGLLEPKTREAAEKALAAIAAVGIKVWVNETLRDQPVQDAYYAQGREPLDAINVKRKAAGLANIGAGESKNIVTHAKVSRHTTGTAIDIYPAGKAGEARWAAPESDYKKFADIMKLFGFNWGGDWPDFKDLPHFELRAT